VGHRNLPFILCTKLLGGDLDASYVHYEIIWNLIGNVGWRRTEFPESSSVSTSDESACISHKADNCVPPNTSQASISNICTVFPHFHDIKQCNLCAVYLNFRWSY